MQCWFLIASALAEIAAADLRGTLAPRFTRVGLTSDDVTDCALHTVDSRILKHLDAA